MPFPRFRLRTLMIAVAVAAILLAGELARRRRALCLDRLAHLARTEEACRARLPLRDWGIIDPLLRDGKTMSRADALAEVARQRRRYEYAASHPWLPIPPDAPPPE